MRAVIPLAGLLLAACAPTTPLDLIPREDLLMMEAADRLERQNPLAIRTPAPPRDVDAEYRAALRAAGLEPFRPAADDQPGDPDAATARRVATRPDPMAVPVAGERPAPFDPNDPATPAPPGSAPAAADPAQPAPSPISVDEMLARVRAQSAKNPEG